MFDIKNPETLENFALFERYLSRSQSFAVTGLTTILRLLLIDRIKKLSKKKILVITSTEQNALRYQNDLKKAFDLEAKLLPFQNISMYEAVSPNRYDYAEQIRILHEKPELVIAPVKVLLEKFPKEKFFKENTLKVKIGDEIDLKAFIKKLVALGYKRTTMVSDIAEFSVRGDIIDVFSLDKNPLRIELWGDEIVDLRYFNNETQKSVEKVKEADILPVYKFILPDEVLEKDQKEDDLADSNQLVATNLITQSLNHLVTYEEGIDIYQNYFNPELTDVFEYLNDYVLVFDERSEIYSKYEFVDENFEKQSAENLKLGLNED